MHLAKPGKANGNWLLSSRLRPHGFWAPRQKSSSFVSFIVFLQKIEQTPNSESLQSFGWIFCFGFQALAVSWFTETKLLDRATTRNLISHSISSSLFAFFIYRFFAVMRWFSPPALHMVQDSSRSGKQLKSIMQTGWPLTAFGRNRAISLTPGGW